VDESHTFIRADVLGTSSESMKVFQGGMRAMKIPTLSNSPDKMMIPYASDASFTSVPHIAASLVSTKAGIAS
jgi:hypothetical protein